jgi:endonuclease YncB( thermonuclease family)
MGDGAVIKIPLTIALLLLPATALAFDPEKPPAEMTAEERVQLEKDQARWLDDMRDVIKEESYFTTLTFERVIDGETFFASGKKIRIWGINAPGSDEPEAPVSTAVLEKFLTQAGKIECKYLYRDGHDSEVMHCFADGHDIGSMMVQTGMAKDNPKFSGHYYAGEHGSAQKAGRGIWQDKKGEE